MLGPPAARLPDTAADAAATAADVAAAAAIRELLLLPSPAGATANGCLFCWPSGRRGEAAWPPAAVRGRLARAPPRSLKESAPNALSKLCATPPEEAAAAEDDKDEEEAAGWRRFRREKDLTGE